MTKPFIYLLLLFGGAIATGAGLLTYAELRDPAQTNFAAWPSEPEHVTAEQRGNPVARAPSAPQEEIVVAPPAGAGEAQKTAPAATNDSRELQTPAAGQTANAAVPDMPSPAASGAAPGASEGRTAQPAEENQYRRPATDTSSAPGEEAAPAEPPSPALQEIGVADSQPSAAPPALHDPQPSGADTAEPAPSEPSFDVVRVEPTGEAVIAGEAGPGAKVQVLSNGGVVAETEADSNGAWVALPDSPLAPGSHDLTIRALSESGEASESAERVAIAVPERPGEEEVLAVLAAPGQPSEVLVGPGPEMPSQEQVSQQLAPASTAAASNSGGQPLPAEAPLLSVDAVEAEGRTMYVAGAGDPGALVRVYVDGELVGEAQAGNGGRWLVEATRPLEEGEVTVRADQVDAGTANVEARAEVPFVRRLDMAALVPVVRGGAGAAQSATGQALPSPTAAIIRRGDNLWTISRRTYGQGVRYTTIYKANQDQIRNPHLIYPGQVFMLPTGDRNWAQN